MKTVVRVQAFHILNRSIPVETIILGDISENLHPLERLPDVVRDLIAKVGTTAKIVIDIVD